jgi:hypothetical protein
VILANSTAARELQSQMEDYCRRLIPGRSILIGGDRGSGKTTLASAVIDKLLSEGKLVYDAKPLFVPIHGPDFFDGVEEAIVPPADDDEAAKNKRRQVARARFALKVLTIPLHRAFTTELGWSLERAAGQFIEPRRDQLHEIVAQLRLDLDADVETDHLRWVWHKLDALENGVLGRPELRRYWTRQGLLEIVAAKSLIEGYIRVAGKVEDLKSSTLQAEIETRIDAEKTQTLVNSIAGAVSGGAAGTGIFLQHGLGAGAQGLLAVLAIPLVGFLTTTLLNLASKSTRTRRSSEERKITFDKSLESLDLIFPLLVNRVLDAGLAPIFVVDELDKLDAAGEELKDLIPRLKHIVSDKAFFCFLVGRDCYFEIRNVIRADEYARESTFFARRIYVNHAPKDWRDYLIGTPPAGMGRMECLTKQQEVTPPLLLSTVAVSSTTERAQDAAYLFRLSYVLLARSRMHAANLHRVIDSWPSEEGLNLQLINLDLPEYRNRIVYQAAVEVVLEGAALAGRAASDAEFRQQLYDVLYEPLRRWEQGMLRFTVADILKALPKAVARA